MSWLHLVQSVITFFLSKKNEAETLQGDLGFTFHLAFPKQTELRCPWLLAALGLLCGFNLWGGGHHCCEEEGKQDGWRSVLNFEAMPPDPNQTITSPPALKERGLQSNSSLGWLLRSSLAFVQSYIMKVFKLLFLKKKYVTLHKVYKTKSRFSVM